MLDTIIIAVRALQLLFALVVLGTGAYGEPFPPIPLARVPSHSLANLPTRTVITLFNQSYTDAWGYTYSGWTPSQLGFIIFVSVWTVLVVAFQLLVPRFSQKLGHKFVVLGLDALTMLLWFAGFIALAVFTGAATGSGLPNWYRTLQACVAFAAFTWYVLPQWPFLVVVS